MLDLVILTPYVAIAASLTLAGTVAAVCFQSETPLKDSGFGRSTERRRVSYRGAVKAVRSNQLQEAA